VEDEVEKIFNNVDTDGSGKIEYSEWIIATINKENLCTPEKLEIAFSIFDKDKSGTICAAEVKEILC